MSLFSFSLYLSLSLSLSLSLDLLQVFDNLFDNQINGFNPSTTAGTSSSDLLEFEEFSVVLRQWANLKSDVVCSSTTPAPLAGSYYNMVHGVCVLIL